MGVLLLAASLSVSSSFLYNFIRLAALLVGRNVGLASPSDYHYNFLIWSGDSSRSLSQNAQCNFWLFSVSLHGLLSRQGCHGSGTS